uniref:Uncharacterized protein n=1 Tax=Calidris pygmaea TaxID=425635 RepID=A0A8C3J7W7_9CHAR
MAGLGPGPALPGSTGPAHPALSGRRPPAFAPRRMGPSGPGAPPGTSPPPQPEGTGARAGRGFSRPRLLGAVAPAPRQSESPFVPIGRERAARRKCVSVTGAERDGREAEDEQRPGGARGGRRRRRRPAAVPAGAEPAVQRPGRLREPAAGARARQGGRGEGAGAAGAAGPHPREGLREAEDLLRQPGEPRPRVSPPPTTGSRPRRPPASLQEQLPAASDADLRGLDGDIAALSSKVQELQQSCRQMEAGECARPVPSAPGVPGGPQAQAAVPRLSALPVMGASFPELKDLNSSMTTPEVAREIEELRKDCAGYTEKLERMKSATNHVTPEEKEKVKSWQGLGQLYQTLRGVPHSPAQLTPVQRRQGVVGDPGCSPEPVLSLGCVCDSDSSLG